jgi:uncharacterized protein (DUF885 family)
MGTEISNDKKMMADKFLHKEMRETWQWRLDTDPELAASLGLLNQRRSKHVLDPRSPQSFRKRLQWVEQALYRIQTGISSDDASAMSKQDRLSYELYVIQLNDYVRYTKEHKAYLMCINRLEGVQTDLPLYAKYLPLATLANRDFYKSFLEAIPLQLDEVMDLLQLGIDEKRTPPKISLDGVISQIRQMVDGGCTAFSDPIGNKSNKSTTTTSIDGWEQQCLEIIANQVGPAFTKLADFLETKYVPNLRSEISSCKGYPNGSQYYQDCLDFHTTTTMTASEIHQLGLDEVTRVKNEMENIAMEAGYPGQLDQFMEYLRSDKKFAPASGEALCAHYRDIAGRIAPALLSLFHVKTLPRTPFQIVETPAAHASMAPAAYYLGGSSDKSDPRPGIFYVNTSEISTRRLYECESLALHEAVPGHHTQIAIQNENEALPEFRRYCEDRRYFEAPCRFPFYTGYVEGWGLHCETLGEELGLYKQPTDKMGQLSMEALRSCRLVVDTGMHALGWTHDEALNFMLENTAMGEHDARTEVARYITWPGQATAYKVGERTLFRLRKKAEDSLGINFDPRDFYDTVLQCGAVPLNTLETLIDEYIDINETIDTVQSKSLSTADFVQSMAFANWCKCCTVPGSCKTE